MSSHVPPAILRDGSFLEHDSPFGYHPERSERLGAIHAVLDGHPEAARAERLGPRRAVDEELVRVHDGRYVRAVREALAGGRPGFLDPDTYFGPGSEAAALGAVGGGIDAALSVWRGEREVVMGLPRPPGHHATRRKPMGFCLFNNIAAAAAALLDAGAERLLVFDWDVHHGNGTQDIFYRDPRVLFFSTHLYPHYPGTGAAEEVGEGPGEGTTVNVPLPRGAGNGAFRSILERLLHPIADAFRPEMVLVSAGYDGHHADPLGGLALDEDGFRMLAAHLRAVALRHGRGRLVTFLEGGYDLDALSASVAATYEGLSDPETGLKVASGEAVEGRSGAAVARAVEVHRARWGLRSEGERAG